MKHPIIRFSLDSKPNKYGEHQIFAFISIGYFEVDYTKEVKKYKSDTKDYKPIKISTRCRIKPEHFGKYVVKGNRKVLVYDEKIFNQYARTNRFLKTRLQKITNAVSDVANQFYTEEINPTDKQFKDALEIKLDRREKEVIKERPVLEFLYDKIKSDRKDLEMKKKGALTENHIKTYVSLSRMFENYQIATKSIVKFSDFNDKAFYWDFFRVVDAIYRDEIQVDNPNQPKKQRKSPTGYGVKSLNKYIKLLHRVLSLGKKSGENLMLDLNDEGLSLENPPAEKEIYLNEQEIKLAIENKTNNEEFKIARQYLIMASFMGLRIDDMERLGGLSPKYYKGKRNNFYGVQVSIGKTKSEVIIPLLKPVRDILKENNNQFPVFKERVVNVSIKKFAKFLKIDTPEKKTKISFNQGKIISEGIPKYELLTTHDCRRSFITNLLNNGVSGERIKYITHPKKVDSKDMIALYNKANLIDKAEAFLEELKFVDSEVYLYQ